MIEFQVAFDPPKATHQGSGTILRRKDGTTFIGRPSSSPGAKAKKVWLRTFKPHKPREPLEGPLEARIEITFPWRTSDTKKVRSRGHAAMPTKPDIDNLMKLVLDAMSQSQFWNDDNQVTDLICRKRLGDNPGITVRIRQIEIEPINPLFEAIETTQPITLQP